MEHIVNTSVRAQHSPSFRPKPRIQSGAKRRNPAGDGNRPYARRSGAGCTPGRVLPFDCAQGRLLRLRSGQAPSTSLRAGYSAVLRTAPVGMTGKGGARHGARRIMTFHDTLHPLAAPARTHCAGPEAQDLGNDAQAGEKRAGAPGRKWRIPAEKGRAVAALPRKKCTGQTGLSSRRGGRKAKRPAADHDGSLRLMTFHDTGTPPRRAGPSGAQDLGNDAQADEKCAHRRAGNGGFLRKSAGVGVFSFCIERSFQKRRPNGRFRRGAGGARTRTHPDTS